jgi:FKBP-type peptidyl-prolyl cis-trans isomerase FkpA
MRFRFLITALLPLAFTACLKGSDPITYPNVPIEETTFAASLNVNLAASTKSATGLYYRDLTVGTGATATSASTVSVYYSGYRADGSRFDYTLSPSNPYGPIRLGANPPESIPGFVEGIVGMKIGGTRQLVIPPSLAYGSAGAVEPQTRQIIIAPNAVLVFTVELMTVQ